MMDLYEAAEVGDLERVSLLVEQGMDKNQVGGVLEHTSLSVAAEKGHLDVVRYLVEQGADMEKACRNGWSPLIRASVNDHLEVVRYLLEQGANRDRGNNKGWTPLHFAASSGHLETTKLLMEYGSDLNARTADEYNHLPIDLARTEEIEQAIRDEPRRRMDHGHKRATEQDRDPNAAASASAQQEDEEVPNNKFPCLDEGAVLVAEDDQDSEPSDDEDGN